jgi:hypothetical protein
LEPLELPLL